MVIVTIMNRAESFQLHFLCIIMLVYVILLTVVECLNTNDLIKISN